MTTRTNRTTKIRRRIEFLQNLIDHPKTSDEERDNAKHAIHRILANNPEHTAATLGNSTDPLMVTGSRYQPGLNIAVISKTLRKEFALRRRAARKSSAPDGLAVVDPIGDLPKDVKISVTISRYAGGQSINIDVRGVPADWWTKEVDMWGDDRRVPTPHLDKLADELASALAAFNYDGSDLQMDVFNVNFHGRVNVDGLLLRLGTPKHY